ncbi:MAG TPA: long-chain fatty acid--CoA ligase [Streptosporangiaceae bacterium]|nr:long-chain fatty acid--CoA ligase [Streptosporangiaceae bacterium]
MLEFGIPALIEIPDDAGLADVVFSRAAADPDEVMLRRRGVDGGWQDVTAGQFRGQVSALAKGLIAAGIQPGDRVAVMSHTRYEWTLADYAIWTAGAVSVPVYETSSAEQVEWIIGDSGARAVIAESDDHARIIESVRGRVPGLGPLWRIENLGDVAAAGGDITDDQLRQHRLSRRAGDLATIIYTSGTTGRPKGCELTHRNLLAAVRNAVHAALPEVFEMPDASTLLFMPLAHVFARIVEIACLEAGAVLGHWPDTGTIAAGLREFRPTFLLAVPRVFEKVYNTAVQQASASSTTSKIFTAAASTAIGYSQALDSGRPGIGLQLRHVLYDRLVYGKLRAAVGGRVLYAVSGGAPLGERLGHFFRGVGITVLEGYGMTETSAAATVNKPSRNKIGTVGQPLPGVSARIADDGEILLYGAVITIGYWQNEAATKDAIDADGWLHTGDLGALDDEGFLRVTGRKKEIIVTAGGKNVAPAVLEDRLRAHPLISQCMVVGDAKPFVACLITLDSEALEPWKQQHGKPADATAADLAADPDLLAELQAAVDDANNAVSRAESIRRFAVLPVDFTTDNDYLTPSLKVKRANVAKDFAAAIEALYAR